MTGSNVYFIPQGGAQRLGSWLRMATHGQHLGGMRRAIIAGDVCETRLKCHVFSVQGMLVTPNKLTAPVCDIAPVVGPDDRRGVIDLRINSGGFDALGLQVASWLTFIQAPPAHSSAPTRIGDNTQGVFSDALERKLPNS
ncbi:MAG: hypothetical protein ACRDSR_11060 [Pseudonocardiaceae bacterium]